MGKSGLRFTPYVGVHIVCSRRLVNRKKFLVLKNEANSKQTTLVYNSLNTVSVQHNVGQIIYLEEI